MGLFYAACPRERQAPLVNALQETTVSDDTGSLSSAGPALIAEALRCPSWENNTGCQKKKKNQWNRMKLLGQCSSAVLILLAAL